MKHKILKTLSLTLLSSSLLLASGWRIPEQSPRSVALSGAYIANSNGADSSYYNPANMVFNENKLQLESAGMYVHLTSIDYTDNRLATYSGSSKEEDKFVPTMFLSSKDMDGFRYGLSITSPGGLSKRWDSTYAKTFAEEFSLRIVELNPTVAYKLAENFSIAGGVRIIYSDGVVKSSGIVPVDLDANGNSLEATDATTTISRDMQGDTIEYGYNIAISYKLSDTSNFSLTYRSNVDLKEEGDATLSATQTLVNANSAVVIPALSNSYDVTVTVPLPAVLALAYSFDIDNTTVELEYDRTYWSKYNSLDFSYDSVITHPVLSSAFDDAKNKNWKDTDAFRIGITHKYSDNLTLMAGFAIDENPAPEATASFELPDSDAKLYSIGCDYKLDKDSSIGFGYLYDKKESRTIIGDSANGTFENASAHLVSIGYRTTF
jgi:long-chain fatty acid transport protein